MHTTRIPFIVPAASLLLGLLSSSCVGEVDTVGTSDTAASTEPCGNSHVEGDEQCDDGDANHDQGPCSHQCTRVGCGDGVLDEDEDCDDGDENVDGDYGGGCSILCVLLPECGDGAVDAIGGEACDDGNDDDNDACLSTCEAARCGDGQLHVGVEECDDGDDDNSDSCLSTCELARCGDGQLHVDVEECDDGNLVDDDGCASNCTTPGCGNGVVEVGEECDDGNEDNTDACLSSCTVASCGDGFTQPSNGEDCDDGNDVPDDGCNEICVRDRVVFVTSITEQGGELGGLEGADSLCQTLADAEGLENAESFRAWLSSPEGSPDSRFVHAAGRYLLLDGRIVAMNWEDLTDGTVWTTIDRTEANEDKTTIVWSNTAPNGTMAEDPYHCANWSVISEEKGRFGFNDLVDANWTNLDDFNPEHCYSAGALYCFEN